MKLVFISQSALSAAARKRTSSARYFSVLSTLVRSNPITIQREKDKKTYALPRISALPLSTNDFSTKPPLPPNYDTQHQKYSARLANVRLNMLKRAGVFRETAKQNYQDFKDDPRTKSKSAATSATAMLKAYGPVFIGTYGCVYFGTLGGLFLGVESGLMDPVGLFNMLGHASSEHAAEGETLSTVQVVVEFMQNHAWLEPYAHYFEKNPQFANLAVAWIAVKFTEPVRLALSVAVTPRIARYFGYSTKKGEGTDGDDNEQELEEETKSEKDPINR